MHFKSGEIHHVYNQGNNRQPIFKTDDDYIKFLELTKRWIVPTADILAYCLMPNHFHFMVQADDRTVQLYTRGSVTMSVLSGAVQQLLSQYAKKYNELNGRSGSLFRQKTKSKFLNESMIIRDEGLRVPDYPAGCFNYIHNNPVTANLAEVPGGWKFSSFNAYANGEPDGICCFDTAARLKLFVH